MTDDFTIAARAEAEQKWPYSANPDPTLAESADAALNAGFVAGAVWARDHLAAQEPTHEEVIAVLNAVTTPFGEEPRDDRWLPSAIQRCREAMMSARAVGRSAMSEDCDRCNYDMHTCPGCGANLPHGMELCARCEWEVTR